MKPKLVYSRLRSLSRLLLEINPDNSVIAYKGSIAQGCRVVAVYMYEKQYRHPTSPNLKVNAGAVFERAS